MSTLSAATLAGAATLTLIVIANAVAGAITGTDVLPDHIDVLALVSVGISWSAWLLAYCRDCIIDRLDRYEQQRLAAALGLRTPVDQRRYTLLSAPVPNPEPERLAVVVRMDQHHPSGRVG